jgi:hypothetical protein
MTPTAGGLCKHESCRDVPCFEQWTCDEDRVLEKRPDVTDVIIISGSTIGGSVGDDSHRPSRQGTTATAWLSRGRQPAPGSAGDDSHRLARQGTTASVWLGRGQQPPPGSAGDDSHRLARLDGGGARACPFPILLSTADALTDMHGDGS